MPGTAPAVTPVATPTDRKRESMKCEVRSVQHDSYSEAALSQPAAERGGEFRVGDRARADGVDRAAERRGRQGVLQGTRDIVDGDPGHELPAVADAAAGAKLERRQHLRERAARPGEDHAEPVA